VLEVKKLTISLGYTKVLKHSHYSENYEF